jgi:hypothetical protein
MRNPISTNIYHQHIHGKTDLPQNDMVIKYMREIDQPHTVRMLHRIMNARGFEIDLVSLRRSVTNLSQPSPKGKWQNQYSEQVLLVASEKPCPITKKTVGWYELTPKFRRDKAPQIELFNSKTKAS